MPGMADDPYKTLGVSKSATSDEIRKAYRDLARKYHPDLHPDDAAAKKKFQEVQAAFDVLNDPKKKEMYDRYGYPGLFTAYNAGPERFDEYLLDGQPLPAETRRYLAALHLASSDMRMRPEWPSGRELFFKLGMPTLDAQPLSLFVPLSKDRLAPSR